MKYKMIILITLVSLFLNLSLATAEELSGKILAVNESKDTILLKNKSEQITEYQLSLAAEIKLNQKDVGLAALRPVDYKSFCEAKMQLNQANKVTTINAAYRAIEVIVTGIRNNNLIVKKINTGSRRKFKLTNKVKLMRNNVLVTAKDISIGDKGLVILGLNAQLQKVIVYNYQLCGFLKESNLSKREIVLNVGTRLKPQYLTLNLPPQVKIRCNQQLIEFKQLNPKMWVKLEIKGSIKQLIVRKI